MKRSLLTGVAYHGNRMPSHVRTDLEKIARADMDVVVHMLSHTDWERHGAVMKDIFKMTEDAGLEVWVDNWGLGGIPGDTSHFLCYHPECHVIYSNGEMHPKLVCPNQPAYRAFVKDWLDAVREMGGKAIFWDEPALPQKAIGEGTDLVYTCACPVCRKKFEEKYGRPMPTLAGDPATAEFAKDTIVDFFRDMSDYAASLGMKNIICFVARYFKAEHNALINEISALPHMDNIGTDPYWCGSKPILANPYEYVYGVTKRMLEVVGDHNKEHNLWIQGYNIPAGREEEIVWATEAAYDAGARTVLSWSFMGGESNTYRAGNPERCWEATVAGMRRIREMERDRTLAEHRALYRK